MLIFITRWATVVAFLLLINWSQLVPFHCLGARARKKWLRYTHSRKCITINFNDQWIKGRQFLLFGSQWKLRWFWLVASARRYLCIPWYARVYADDVDSVIIITSKNIWKRRNKLLDRAKSNSFAVTDNSAHALYTYNFFLIVVNARQCDNRPRVNCFHSILMSSYLFFKKKCNGLIASRPYWPINNRSTIERTNQPTELLTIVNMNVKISVNYIIWLFYFFGHL